jgi:hypothetical protein
MKTPKLGGDVHAAPVGARIAPPPQGLLQRHYRKKTACGFDQAAQSYQKTLPVCCGDCQVNWLLRQADTALAAVAGLTTRLAHLQQEKDEQASQLAEALRHADILAVELAKALRIGIG